MGEEIFIQLRYCFAAGYTLPQFCADKGIKKPLFILEKKFDSFLKEIYAQFNYDGRVTAQFCFIDYNEKSIKIPLGQRVLGPGVTVKNIAKIQFDKFDKIILLTKEPFEVNSKKVIPFVELEKFFIQHTYVDIPVLSFLQRYPEVKFFLTNFPKNIKRYEGGEAFDLTLWSAEQLKKALVENKTDDIKTPFDKFGYTNEEVVQLLEVDRSKKNLDGSTSLLDDNHPLKRVQNGKRITAYQPEKYLNKIYFVGPCFYFGRNAPFDKTIESYLQQMLNENNLPYRVENEGQAFVGRSQDMFYNLNALNPEPGDIIFFYSWDIHAVDKAIPFFNVNNAFDPPIDYREVFCTKAHVNELGYKILAEKYFDFLTKNHFFRDKDFNYPILPPLITVTVYRRNSRRAARRLSSTRNWRLTSRRFVPRKFQLAQSS